MSEKSNITIERIDEKTITVKGTKPIFSMTDGEMIVIAFQPIKSAQVYLHPSPEDLFLKSLSKITGVREVTFDKAGTLKVQYNEECGDVAKFKIEIAAKVAASPLKALIKNIEYLEVPSGYVVCNPEGGSGCGKVVKPLNKEDEDSRWSQCPACGQTWGHSIKPGFG